MSALFYFQQLFPVVLDVRIIPPKPYLKQLNVPVLKRSKHMFNHSCKTNTCVANLKWRKQLIAAIIQFNVLQMKKHKADLCLPFPFGLMIHSTITYGWGDTWHMILELWFWSWVVACWNNPIVIMWLFSSNKTMRKNAQFRLHKLAIFSLWFHCLSI